jgi:uncharacterized protein YeaO (DUF488 family)
MTGAGAIRIQRVYEAPAAGEGLRILVDRLWPRGLKKENAALDLWCKDVAPSPQLRLWFGHRAERFEEFAQRYREELHGNPAVDDLLQFIGRRKALLLYAARDPEVNHALVLADHLRRRKRKP